QRHAQAVKIVRIRRWGRRHGQRTSSVEVGPAGPRRLKKGITLSVYRGNAKWTHRPGCPGPVCPPGTLDHVGAEGIGPHRMNADGSRAYTIDNRTLQSRSYPLSSIG